MRDRFVRFYTDDLVRISRRRRARQIFPRKSPQSLPLTPQQRQEISSFWKQYRNMDKEMRWFAFYNASCEDKARLKYYIPDGVYFSDIDAEWTDPRRSDDLDDKNLYDLYFHDVSMPRTVMRKINGFLLDKDYHVISMEQALDLCQAAGAVVCKEARLSQGGHGVTFFDFSKHSREEFRHWLANVPYDNLNVQEVIRQHESLNKIHADSINSVRIISFMFDGQVHILSSILRMGRDGATVDNASMGGIMCGIKEGGQLGQYAYDENGNRWAQHPQGTVFKDTRIVGHDRCCQLIGELAGRLCTTTRLISWDFAIGEDGEPILIEVNLTYGGVVIHQLCNGPIFGDLTERVLNEIYKSGK